MICTICRNKNDFQNMHIDVPAGSLRTLFGEHYVPKSWPNSTHHLQRLQQQQQQTKTTRDMPPLDFSSNKSTDRLYEVVCMKICQYVRYLVYDMISHERGE